MRFRGQVGTIKSDRNLGLNIIARHFQTLKRTVFPYHGVSSGCSTYSRHACSRIQWKGADRVERHRKEQFLSPASVRLIVTTTRKVKKSTLSTSSRAAQLLLTHVNKLCVYICVCVYITTRTGIKLERRARCCTRPLTYVQKSSPRKTSCKVKRDLKKREVP